MGNRPIGSISSPSTSVRTPIPTPNPRSFNRSSIGQSPAFPLPPPEPRIDPSLALLNVPPPNRSRSAMDNSSNVDPFISRFYGAGIHDEPWSTERMRNSSVATGRSSFSQSGLNFGGYRDIPPSDIESIARSDSGYYTREARSVIGSEPDRVDQELPSGMTFQMHAINVNSASSEPGESYRLQSDQTSQYSAPSQGKTTHKCPKCKETSKCPSDFKCVHHVSWVGSHADGLYTESICSNMISRIRVITPTVGALQPGKVSLLSMIFSGIRKVFTELGSRKTPISAPLSIAGTGAKFGPV